MKVLFVVIIGWGLFILAVISLMVISPLLGALGIITLPWSVNLYSEFLLEVSKEWDA